MEFLYNNWKLVVALAALVAVFLVLYYILIYRPRKRSSEHMEKMLSVQAIQAGVREWKATVREQDPGGTPAQQAPSADLLRRAQTLVYGAIRKFPWDSDNFLLIGLVPKDDPTQQPEWIIYLHHFRPSREQLNRLVGPGGTHYATEALAFDRNNDKAVLRARVFFTFLMMKPGTDEWETWGVGDPNNAWWYLQAFQKAMGMEVTITDEKLKLGTSDTLAMDADLMGMIARGDDGSPMTGQFQAIRRPTTRDVIEHVDEIVEVSGEHPAVQVEATKQPLDPRETGTLILGGGSTPSAVHRGPTLIDSSHSGATQVLTALSQKGDPPKGTGSP